MAVCPVCRGARRTVIVNELDGEFLTVGDPIDREPCPACGLAPELLHIIHEQADGANDEPAITA
jgi:hypothetical protein